MDIIQENYVEKCYQGIYLTFKLKAKKEKKCFSVSHVPNDFLLWEVLTSIKCQITACIVSDSYGIWPQLVCREACEMSLKKKMIFKSVNI